jgi:hypothetical protein
MRTSSSGCSTELKAPSASQDSGHSKVVGFKSLRSEPRRTFSSGRRTRTYADFHLSRTGHCRHLMISVTFAGRGPTRVDFRLATRAIRIRSHRLSPWLVVGDDGFQAEDRPTCRMSQPFCFPALNWRTVWTGEHISNARSRRIDLPNIAERLISPVCSLRSAAFFSKSQPPMESLGASGCLDGAAKPKTHRTS